MTPAGIEPGTFRVVAQRLNHCTTAPPNNNNNNNNNNNFICYYCLFNDALIRSDSAMSIVHYTFSMQLCYIHKGSRPTCFAILLLIRSSIPTCSVRFIGHMQGVICCSVSTLELSRVATAVVVVFTYT